jgi:hypothetical protein
MTPYLQLHLLLAALSGGVAVALEFGLGRVGALREHPWRRLLASYVALAVPLFAWVLAVRRFDHSHSTFQFISVAVGYYAGVLALPALTLVRAARARQGVLAGAGAAVLGVGLWALLVEPDRLVTVEREVRVAPWSAAAPPLRVVHISDLQTVGACEREREAARRINALEPELIVFSGDYAAGPFRDPEPAIAAARQFLGELRRPRLGIVCVPGHAESERVRERIFAGLDVVYLANREVELELDPPGTPDARRLRIFGTRTLHEGFSVEALAPRAEPGLLNVVLAHEPDVAWDLLDKQVDLLLCGHTHGGQLVVPFFGAPMTLSRLPRRFARGLHEFGALLVNVNPGLGMEGNFAPRIRLFCPPQIDLLVLRGGGVRPTGAAPERS